MRLMDRALQEHSDDEAEKRLYDHMKSKVEEIRATANRISNESIWMTNIAYLAGVSGVTYNAQTRAFESVNQPGRYAATGKLHANKILPTVQNRLSRLCKNPPRYDVMPESNSQDDKDAARLAVQVLTSIWDKQTLNEKRINLMMWTQQCGHAYMKVVWDDEEGNWITDPITGEKIKEGDVCAHVVSPFEVFPDPLAKTFDDVLKSWLIQAKVRKLDYFRSRYGEKGEKVKEEGAWLMSAQYEQRINTLTQRGSTSAQAAIKDCAIELIKYEAPSKKHPRGRMIVGANGVILEDKELPCGEIPFAKFDDIVVAGKYASEAIITHLRSVQDQYNETIRRRAEWTRSLLAGKYLVARGHNLGEESLNDTTEVLEFDPVPNASDPRAIDVPVIPQYAYAEEDRLIAMMNDISGISEVSRGTLPSASIPAIGMQLLVEQDDTRIGVMVQQHEFAWARVGKLILKHVKEFYKIPRKLKLAGSHNGWAVLEVAGADLKENIDAIVKPGSSLPGSKTLRRQEILNAFTQGLLGNPGDPAVRERVLGLMEFGDVQGIWEQYALDKNQIKRGLEKIEKGEPIQVQEFDNHTLWLQDMNDYRKTEKYDRLPDDVKALFMATMEAHLDWIVKNSTPGSESALGMGNSEKVPMPPLASEPLNQEEPQI